MIPMNAPHEEVRSENVPVDEAMANEPVPQFAEILLETAEVLDTPEGFKLLQKLNVIMIGFHNTITNPRNMELRDFTLAKAVKMKFPAPPMDPNIALPKESSLYQFILKKNGKYGVFSVEDTFKEPWVAMNAIHLCFNS